MSFTRGFSGRGQANRDERLPPGQYDAGAQWPVLTAEVTPKLATDTWTFTVEGLVDAPTTWTWDELHAFPPSTYDGDIHCVTTWSKFGMTWTGVSVDTLLEAAGPCPSATHVLAITPHRLHHQPPARRRDRRQGVGRVGGRRRPARRPTTAARPGCWSPTSTSGRAPSGWPVCSCSTTTNPASGSATATTIAATLARAALPGRLSAWTPDRRQPVEDRARRLGRATRPPNAKTFRLALPEPTHHRAGQHYVVRLTAPDGYTASRSYSVASAPDGSTEFELTVERLADGEVSTFLHDVRRGRRRARGARPDRRVVRVGRRYAGRARRRRLGRRPADGDAAPGTQHRPHRPGAR